VERVYATWRTGTSDALVNTYYHLRVRCVQLKWPTFDPHTQVVIDDDIWSRLLQPHKDAIMGELGLHL